MNSTSIFVFVHSFFQHYLVLSLKHSIEFFSFLLYFPALWFVWYLLTFSDFVEILTLLMHYTSDFGENLHYFELFIRSVTYLHLIKVYFSSFIFYIPVYSFSSTLSSGFCTLDEIATSLSLDRVVLFRRWNLSFSLLSSWFSLKPLWLSKPPSLFLGSATSWGSAKTCQCYKGEDLLVPRCRLIGSWTFKV